MIKQWDDLPFWHSGEWQVIQERLDDLEKAKRSYSPRRELLFSALDACPYSDVRACIMGQDPYPDPGHATGLAFSVPRKLDKLPLTLQNILKEYQHDLGYDDPPKHGDLSTWAKQGVLLWNAVPSCEAGKPGSHRPWCEWDMLTQQIVEALSDKGIVFGLLGGYARAYKKFIDMDCNEVVETAHPSPLAVNNKKSTDPFMGSRFFSTINAKLCGLKLEPVEWRLS